MQRIITVLFLVLLVGLPAAILNAEVIVEHDRFSGKPIMKLKTPFPIIRDMDGRPDIFSQRADNWAEQYQTGWTGLFNTPDQSVFNLVVSVIYNDYWRYLNCKETYWLLDDTPLKLPHIWQEADIITTRHRWEAHAFNVNRSQLSQLANARKLEYKLCDDAYIVTLKDLQAIQAFISKVRGPHTTVGDAGKRPREDGAAPHVEPLYKRTPEGYKRVN